MLTFVPTPIGNLEDISLRSIELIKQSDIILCEDTRVSSKLLNLLSQRLEIDFGKKDYIYINSHNESDFIENISLDFFDKNVIYLSDAGMPCVSDPGAKLVDFCIKNSIVYDVLPGANALLTAYAMSGFDYKEFVFYGFLPHKVSNRKEQLQKIFSSEYVNILYESPHRIIQLLEEMNKIDSKKEIFLVKELTKKFQRSFKGSSKEILEVLKKENTKGEWVVVVSPNIENRGSYRVSVDDILALDAPKKQLSKLLSKMTNKSVKECYNSFFEEN
jgi:16S rRNA (cytidine1402-2'-O)-methyltransferase